MKKEIIAIIFILLVSLQVLNAQSSNQSTLSVTGYARAYVYPDSYRLTFLLQEEERKSGYTAIGKTSIDTIQMSFFQQLTKYKIETSLAKLLKKSSRDLSQYPNVLHWCVYEIIVTDKKKAMQLVDEFRIPGLDGIIAKGLYIKSFRDVEDSLQTAAMAQAKNKAEVLAQKLNVQLGNISCISDDTSNLADKNTETYEQLESYSLARFEMSYNERKSANTSIRLEYELKK